MENKQLQQDAQARPEGKKLALSMLLFFCVAVALFLGVNILTARNTIDVRHADELAAFDFSSNIASISVDCFDIYPEALYIPDDFAAGRAAAPSEADDGNARYYTYRLLLPLNEGVVYGWSGYSATYAYNLWVDGALLASVGTPGDSLESMTPKTDYVTVYFTAGPGQTEIVIQRSDFVHANGGRLRPQALGEQRLITAHNNGIKFSGAFMVGSLIMVAVFFFGIFLFFSHRRQFLYFSLACFFFNLRTLSIDHKLIMTLFPELSWPASHRMEGVGFLAFIFFFILYINLMFDMKPRRRFNIFGLSLVISYFLLVMLTPAIVYTRFLPYMQIAFALYIISLLVLLARDLFIRRKALLTEHYIVFTGIAGYAALQLLDLVLYRFGNLYDDWNITHIGVMVLVFANTLALVFNFSRTENEVRQLAVDNAALDRVNTLKTDLMRTISHETLTPLSVMKLYAEITAEDARKSGQGSEFVENLDTIADEAKRVSGLMEEMRQLALARAYSKETHPVDIGKIITQVAGLYAKVLKRKGTTLSQNIEDGLPLAYGNDSELTQVIFNLLRNSDNHTENGTVTIRAEYECGKIRVTVADTGSGIPPKLLPRVFERGVHGDNEGSGFGLAVCRDIITAYGGEIWLESEYGKGTTATFILPAYADKGDTDNE